MQFLSLYLYLLILCFLENSSEIEDLEPAKIIKTNTEYPELEILAELLNFLPTTSDRK